MPTVLPRNDRWSVVGAVMRWWRRWTKAHSESFELESCSTNELERMARDMGMPASDLRVLVRHGPDEGNLLQRRLAALHLDPDELARAEPAMLRDLQRLCTMCRSRGRCVRDLTRESADSAWQDWREYCPMLSTLKSCSDVH